MSFSSFHLSSSTRRTLDAVSQASEFEQLGLKKTGVLTGGHKVVLDSAGPTNTRKVAKKIAKAFQELHQQMATPGVQISNEDRQQIQQLFQRLSSNDPALASIRDQVAGLLGPDSESFVQNFEEMVPLSKREMQKINTSLQESAFNIPQAPEMSKQLEQMNAALQASQKASQPLEKRAELYPQASGAGSATGSYRIRIATNIPAGSVKGAHEYHLNKAKDVDSQIIAIAKPASQGLKEEDAKAWGMIDGQEPQGEHLTCFLQQTLGLPTNVPETVAAPLSHEVFTSRDQNLTELQNIGFALNHLKCLKIMVELEKEGRLSPENFQDAILDLCYTQASEYLADALIKNGIEFEKNDENMAWLKNTIANAADSEAITSQILEKFWNPDDLANAPTRKILPQVQINCYTLLEKKERIKEIGGNLYDHFTTSKPTETSSFCSIQSWVNGCTPMPFLSDEQLATVPGIAYARIELIDQMMVGRDRNAGNIMFQTVNQDDLASRLDKEIPDFSAYAIAQATSALGELEDRPAVGSKEEEEMAAKMTEEILSSWEESHPKIDPSKMNIEWDTHLLVVSLIRGESTILDAVPIDNAIVLPDPKIRSYGKSCIEYSANNAWICEPQARTTHLPPRTRAHLQSLDLRKGVLPQVIKEHNRIKSLAGAQAAQGMPLNEDQQKLWLLSATIQQVGVEMNKTCFEIGLMKDDVKFTEKSWKAPLPKIYSDLCANVPLDKIKLDTLRERIKQEFDIMEQTVGTYETNFDLVQISSNAQLALARDVFL